MAYTHDHWERRSSLPFKSQRGVYGISETMLDDFKRIVAAKAAQYDQIYFQFMHQTRNQF